MRLTVATLTFRRPDDLPAALAALVPHVEAVPGAELLVVDNDTVPSARDVVLAWSDAHPVRYVHEPSPGIAAARNRALVESASSDLVVFVDDDERPRAGWLAALLRTFESERCLGVAGAVVSVFEQEPDAWIRAGRFFERLRHPTGTVVPVVATNNLLLDARVLRAWGLTFDEAFGLTGGSDTVFSLEAGRRGGRFVWCDEAVVEDAVPASRATRSWVLRRAYRMGNTGVRARVHVAPDAVHRWGARGAGAARGAVRVVGGRGAGAARRADALPGTPRARHPHRRAWRGHAGRRGRARLRRVRPARDPPAGRRAWVSSLPAWTGSS
ncbi:glycosyltransferase family 2 protein [Cellulomonas massiliensis]|uniref:glycosyltransferase family 2 protein n=1 Tax=Cellulomonas massiliensis TaxID=1465811 RepID=UPI001C54D674|nr:glycosyltransferase family A protein [Cellulomonas massiliensis]